MSIDFSNPELDTEALESLVTTAHISEDENE